MISEEAHHDSFAAFKNSFYYGSRSDMNFKFLKDLSDQDAGRFFQELLWKMGDSLDDGRVDRLAEHVYAWQVRGYAGEGRFVYADGPFAPLRKPVAASRLALVTSSGHFVAGQDPKPFGVEDMTQQEAEARIFDFLKTEPQLSSIPSDTSRQQLRVRHGGYDIRGAQADPNVVFPLERLAELQQEGMIGELAPDAYSFVGACAQTRLLNHSGPQWVKVLQEQEVDIALLVPGCPVCHVSVGHVARLLEAAGIATVVIAVGAFRDRMKGMILPRVLVTPHPMGRPVGAPGDVARQRAVIRAALTLLESADHAGTMLDLGGEYLSSQHGSQ